MENFYSKPLL